MPHPPALRDHARSLRSSGESLKTIAAQLAVSSSTVLAWTKDIALTDEQNQHLMHRERPKTRAALSDTKQRRVTAWRAEAEREWPLLRLDPLFTCGVGLYWGEGTKGGNALIMSNSDPDLIAVWARWVRAYVPSARLRASVLCHDTGNKEEIISYWSAIIGDAPIKVYLAQSTASQHKSSRRIPFGTAHIALCRGSAKWHMKMLRWIELLPAYSKFMADNWHN